MQSLNEIEQQSTTSVCALFFVTIAVGIGSGVLGMSLALLLHYIQHLTFGYSPDFIISSQSFFAGVSTSSPERRVVALIICGLIAGLGWWGIYRFGKPLVSIAEAIKTEKPMPIITTSLHALVQIITIAMGSPLGREVAPREVGAVFASWLATKAGLNTQETKIMLACGAGAGLAAVYNVPLGGAVFILEVLLCTWSWSVVIPAITTSAIAVLVSWWGLGNVPTYYIPELTINASLIIWSIITGPIFGISAYWFIKIATSQRKQAPRNWIIILSCLLNFSFIGVIAIYFPSLLGNGKSVAQIEFASPVGIGMSLCLLVLRCVITWSSLRAGAQGGLLTPSLANGALMAVVLGGLWNYLWPTSSPLEAFAIIGATAFLAAAQKMPLAAVVLLFEFTRMDLSFLVPMLFAVAGSVSTSVLCKNNVFKG